MENNKQNTIESENELQFTDLMKICYGHLKLNWGWFVLSVIVCLIGGYIYLQRQPRIYQSQAVMLIENMDPSGMGSFGRSNRGNMNSLLELNGITVGDNLKNEIFVLTTRRLMERVVDSLDLNVEYSIAESLHSRSLYRSTPFVAEFGDSVPEFVRFEVKVLNPTQYELSKLSALFEGAPEPTEFEQTLTGEFGTALETPVGPICLTKQEEIFASLEDKDGKFTQCEINVSRSSIKSATGAFRARMSASEYDKESSLIVLACNDNNVARANDVLNEIFLAYKRDAVEYKNRIAQSTAEFIDSRIDLISKELNDVEDSYESFMEENNLVDLKMDASAYITETNEARKHLLALETELAVSNYLTEYLIKHSNDEQPIPVLGGLGTASTALATQIAEYNKLLMERTRRTENASDQNPRIRELNKYITGLYASIKAGLESNIKALELKLADARKQDRKVNARINKLPEKQRRAIDIERQKVLKEALYTYLLNKREEVALQLAIEEANVRLVEEPMATGGPVSPRSSMILFASFIIGLLIPSGILFLLEQFNTKAKRRHDIEKATSVPIVGEIPEWKNHQDAQTIADVKSDSPISEAFRVLRYQLDFFRHNAKVYVVTSSTPHQGKSFTSKNLATVLGMAEKRVLIVDADIRKRSISRALSNTKRQGLTSYLNEEAGTRSLASYVEKDSVYPSVDFLPGGIMPPNPTELLMSSRLEELIEEAKQTYDYIVIDTTPMLSVADASIVDRVADVTLFVIRMGVEELSFLPQLDKLNRDKKLRNMALVLNDIDLRKSYGYGYGYGYSYGYGYGENHGKKKKKGLFGKK